MITLAISVLVLVLLIWLGYKRYQIWKKTDGGSGDI